MTTTLDVDGVTELLSSIGHVVDELQDLEAVNLAAAGEVLGYVRPPVRTGRLASTVHAEADSVGFRVVAGGPQAPYGPIVHARVPFLDLALEQRESAVIDVYTDHLEDLLDSIKGA